MMNISRLLVHNLIVLDRLQLLSRIKINSYIYTTVIEGNVLKADDTRYVDADLIALTNNGLLYLFSSLKSTLAGQTVEHVNYLLSGYITS